MWYGNSPLDANILLADDIELGRPATQNAIFEAIRLQRISQGGQDRPLSKPFFLYNPSCALCLNVA